MGLFSRLKRAGGAAVSDRAAERADVDALEAFVDTRRGVEAFVEPPTSVAATTLLLVASDGEWTRKKISSAKAAASFARKHGLPLYDATRVGYPQRMRDYNQRVSQQRSTSAPPRRPTADPARTAALTVLGQAAGVELAPDPSREELTRVWKRARMAAHPDRRNGDRGLWDQVEEAGRTLELH